MHNVVKMTLNLVLYRRKGKKCIEIHFKWISCTTKTSCGSVTALLHSIKGCNYFILYLSSFTHLVLCPGWYVLQQVNPIHYHTFLFLHRDLEHHLVWPVVTILQGHQNWVCLKSREKMNFSLWKPTQSSKRLRPSTDQHQGIYRLSMHVFSSSGHPHIQVFSYSTTWLGYGFSA